MNAELREAAYVAVYASGQLTQDAWTNARIWYAVEAALNAAIGPLQEPTPNLRKDGQ